MSVHGTYVGPTAALKWSGVAFELVDDTLEGVGIDSRVTLDGWVHMLRDGARLAMAAADRVFPGPDDGYAYDLCTGFWAAWQGKGQPTVLATTMPALQFDDGDEVVFMRMGIGTTGALSGGQLRFSTVRPRSLARLRRRLPKLRAKPASHSLMICRGQTAPWPPPVRVPNKAYRPNRAWDEPGHGGGHNLYW